jgi:uncharacterized membrane protein YeaQ/YmgE (transglycosylase-associated protein family)
MDRLSKANEGGFFMDEILQIVGAIMILGAFALAQFRVLNQQSYPYLFFNVIGSGILAALAAIEQQWGFLLLEGSWVLVSLWGIITRLRGCTPAPAH